MSNCLVTKLKANVSKKDLPVFGYKRLFFRLSADNAISYLKSSTSSVNEIVYDNDYNVIKRNTVLPTNAIAYGYGKLGIRIADVDNYTKIDELNVLSADSAELFGLIESGELSGLKNISITWGNGYGKSIAVFSSSVLLEQLSINNTPNIIGALETLLAALFSNGRQSGTLTFISNSVVTLNGAATSGTYSVTFNSTGCVVTKNDVTVATYSNGVWTYAS